MNVVLFRDLPSEGWPSMEVYAERLANGLRQLRQPDLSVTEFVMRGWQLPFNLRIPRGHNRFVSLETLMLYWNRMILYPRAARSHQSGINHILDNSYGHLVEALTAARTIVTSHGGTPITWRQWNMPGPSIKLFDRAFAGMLKAARIIIVSEYSKREITEHYDYPPDRIHVVHHGIDEHYQPLPATARTSTRATFLTAKDQYLILHVGSCIARKNIESILAAIAQLRHQGLAVRFLQIGGSFSAAQVELIERLNISNYITQLPSLPNAALVELYNAADVLVFPSLYEGFGIPLIEAMACGTPIVCSDYELFHEVCNDAACFVDVSDTTAFTSAIANVLIGAIADNLRLQGLERAKLFSWQRTAQQTLDVYRLVYEETHS
jgi:glycosyltransferase involved in cell wall biosynthesis